MCHLFKISIFGVALLLGSDRVLAQSTTAPLPPKPVQYIEPVLGVNDTIQVFATVMPDGTLVPTSYLDNVEVIGKWSKQALKKQAARNRLRNAVYVTYPYALKAGQIINDINAKLAGMTDHSERRKIIKSYEKDLKKNFADKIKDLSVYQGKVLMKLINRQTGNNCYDILKEYKGGVNAQFWQTVAFVLGSSLKQSYDANGDDREVEFYVREVEMLYGGPKIFGQ
ncbi:DUF4294 domain-containing protein [Polluticaenibacter yanchengensis]|uniref:DUF4294 domain-containing protein n=1 Tax=Polluticaenibacter yanchengensis TaxID=3014562 RepID=A0ABT4UKG5_9BACT|nr:DUF4294 domain-containing protein [Chitinophagaceae bacterium LY-5]